MAIPSPPREPEDAYADMERREQRGERGRSVQREADETVAGFVAWPAIWGALAGGAIGALIGLLFAVVPGWGLNYWAGIICGFFGGITIGGLVGARVVLDRAGEPGESFQQPGAPARRR